MTDQSSEELRLPLERGKILARNQQRWIRCLPFVENQRGILIHRPRSASTYNIHKSGPHVGINFWCGMDCSGDGKKFTFLTAPPVGRILCERCELIAVLHGLPSADSLAGRHVHKGGVVAVATCCKEAITPSESHKENRNEYH